MKTCFRYIFCLLGIFAFCGCEMTLHLVPCVVLSERQIVLDSNSQQHSVSYSIKDSFEQIGLTAGCDADWITGLEVTPEKILFNAERNTTPEKRLARIALYYPLVAAPDTIFVTQKSVEISSITLNKTYLSLHEGESVSLTAQVYPHNAADAELIWSSNNSRVASVDPFGYVTANYPGTAVIKVFTRNSAKQATCNVKVSRKLYPGTETFTANGVSFNMIRIEGRSFTMGATEEQGNSANSDESPAHSVTLSNYSIGESEVTQRLWQAVMGSNPSAHRSSPELPVDMVSWEDVVNGFIPKLNALTGKTFSLPTEAQWEFAARGGFNSDHYIYSGSNMAPDVAWLLVNSENTTHEVCQMAPNELGLYDMSGNVLEWCSDWYGSYESSSQQDPAGPLSGNRKVLRGGSFYDSANDCRVSFRTNHYPTYKYDHFGFRLAMN